MSAIRLRAATAALATTILFSASAHALTNCKGASAPVTYKPCEVQHTATGTYTNPYIQFNHVTAVFRNIGNGQQIRIKGFYDDANVWKFRFTALSHGTWTYSVSSDPFDSGLNVSETAAGTFVVNNDAAAKGFLRRDTTFPTKVVHDNNSYPFVWGQTYYQLINNYADPASGGTWSQAVTNSLSNKMTKFRLLLYPWWGDDRTTTAEDGIGYGIFFDSQPFNGGINSPLHNQLRYAHWRSYDALIEDLMNRGALVELILFKDKALGTPDEFRTDLGRTFGPNAPANPAQNHRYVRNAVARYGSFPNVVFCLSNEYQNAYDNQTYWNTIGDIIRQEDDYFVHKSNGRIRLLSIHQKTGAPFLFRGSRSSSTGGWATHAIIQYGTRNGATANPDAWGDSGIVANLGFPPEQLMPVFNDEYGYLAEENGNFVGKRHRQAAWGIAIAGGYGTAGDRNDAGGADISLTGEWAARTEWTEIRHMVNFFTNQLGAWYRMSRVDPTTIVRSVGGSNVSRVYALAEPNVQYAFYNANGVAFDVVLPAIPGKTWTVRRFNPRNGNILDLRTSTGGLTKVETFNDSTETDWAYWIK